MIKRIIKILTKIYKLIKYPHELFQLRNLLGITTINLMRYFVRLSMSKNFKRVDSLNCYLIYFVVRHIQPKIVIETGVGPGSSSAFILKALEDNKNGVLYSIDLPGNDAIAYPKIGKNFNIHTPKGWSIGWFIPPWLKHRHKLIIGDSRKELPKVLNKINKKDEHILMEFNTIFPYMGKRGILLCDDVKDSWSLAFIKFCETKKITYKVFDHRLGIAKLE